MGYRIKEFREKRFPGQGGQTECALALGVTRQELSRWESGGRNPNRKRLIQMAELFGVTVEELLEGGEAKSAISQEKQEGKSANAPPPAKTLPKGNAIRRKGDQDAAHNVLHLRAVGDAAALESGTSHRSGFDDEELFWDNVEEIPESTHLVRIRGDSMAPLMLHGQFVMVGPQYFLETGDVPGNRDIVVASVDLQDTDIGGRDSEWEGVHCKRVQDAGTTWLFTSINPKGESFTVAKEHCRLWRVIGVYFAGRGKPPEED